MGLVSRVIDWFRPSDIPGVPEPGQLERDTLGLRALVAEARAVSKLFQEQHDSEFKGLKGGGGRDHD